MTEFERTNSGDEQLLALLRTITTETGTIDPADSVPSHVSLGSIWVHDWHRAEAELAVIESDSDFDQLVGVRGPSAVRDLVFVADGVECEIDVTNDGAGYVVAGRLVPSDEVGVTLCIGGMIASARSDEFGRFRIEGLPHGTAIGFLETETRTIRIPPFVLGQN